LYSIPWNSFIPVGGTASCTVSCKIISFKEQENKP
jgi:hypothetical protein